MQSSFAAKLQPLPSHTIIKLAPLNLIDAKAQVRTTTEKDAIKELAADIRRHGPHQPILVRPGAGGRFTIQTLGAAAPLNNLKKFAVVASATDSIETPLSRAISSATNRT